MMTALYPLSALLAPDGRSVRTGAERLQTAKSDEHRTRFRSCGAGHSAPFVTRATSVSAVGMQTAPVIGFRSVCGDGVSLSL